MVRKRSRRSLKAVRRRFTLNVLALALFLAGTVLVLRPTSLDVTKRQSGEKVDFVLDGTFGARFAGEMIAQKRNLFPQNVTLRASPNDPDFVASVAREHAIGVTSGQNF